MKNIEDINKANVKKISAEKKLPEFFPGDIIKKINLTNLKMKTIEEINQANVKKIAAEKKLPNFSTGDIVKVGVRITEGKRDRIQYFEGVCIAKKNK